MVDRLGRLSLPVYGDNAKEFGKNIALRAEPVIDDENHEGGEGETNKGLKMVEESLVLEHKCDVSLTNSI